MKRKVIIAIVTLSLLTACSSEQQHYNLTNINDLQNLTANDSNTPTAFETGGIRTKAIEDTAMSLGAQGGLAWASTQINERLNKDKWYLETIYNFNGMMLSHGVLPPVLEEGDNSLNQDDPNTIRISDKTYLIVQQARFATTPPNWRDYIWLPFNKPEMPNKVLLPRDENERKLWAKNIRIGWDKGIAQAYSIFQQNLARLKRDFNGMVIYRKLLQQHMISAPFVSKTELGVTGDGTDMRINDQVLRITELPKLQTDSSNWKAVVVKENDY